MRRAWGCPRGGLQVQFPLRGPGRGECSDGTDEARLSFRGSQAHRGRSGLCELPPPKPTGQPESALPTPPGRRAGPRSHAVHAQTPEQSRVRWGPQQELLENRALGTPAGTGRGKKGRAARAGGQASDDCRRADHSAPTSRALEVGRAPEHS